MLTDKVPIPTSSAEDIVQCLKKYPRFKVVHMVSKRMNELERGSKPLIDSDGLSLVEIALREIAEEKITLSPPENASEES